MFKINTHSTAPHTIVTFRYRNILSYHPFYYHITFLKPPNYYKSVDRKKSIRHIRKHTPGGGEKRNLIQTWLGEWPNLANLASRKQIYMYINILYHIYALFIPYIQPLQFNFLSGRGKGFVKLFSFLFTSVCVFFFRCKNCKCVFCWGRNFIVLCNDYWKVFHLFKHLIR